MMYIVLCVLMLIAGIGVGFIFAGLMSDGRHIGAIIVDEKEDLVYLAFHQGYSPQDLIKMEEVHMRVITQK